MRRDAGVAPKVPSAREFLCEQPAAGNVGRAILRPIAPRTNGIGPPLRGLFVRMKGGFYHDGRFATLQEVVNHYDTFFNLKLSEEEKADLTEYLKSL